MTDSKFLRKKGNHMVEMLFSSRGKAAGQGKVSGYGGLFLGQTL